jgi:DNA-binding NarL/FixJ family response regulator
MDHSGSVLVIDDERQWQDNIRTFLVTEGFSVDTAAELGEARDLLARAPYDLLLVDRQFGLDNERGLQIVETLKRDYPDQEIILLTSYLDSHAAINVMMNDAHTALSKGDPDALLRGVRSVMLKKRLQLASLPRVSMNVFSVSPTLAPLRDELLVAAEPRACFLEVVALAHFLAAVNSAERDTLGRVVKGSRLAEQLPCLIAQNEGTRLKENALVTLAELAPAVVAKLGTEEARAVFHSPRCVFVAGREPLRRLLIQKLGASIGASSIDLDRVVALHKMLEADLGLAPFVLEMATSCLLNRASDPMLRVLNLESLVQLHAKKVLDRMRQVYGLAKAHTYAGAMEQEIEAIGILLDLQHSYDYLNEIHDYPLEHGDWLQTFAQHIIPLMAQARLLHRHETMLPQVTKATDNCEILLHRYNEKFVDFVWDDSRGYTAWVHGGEYPRPLMTPDMLREIALPALHRHRNLFLIIFDGMSLLSWARIKDRYLANLFDFERDEQAMAVVPTATRYARSAIFAGKLPREFMSGLGQKNPNERRLLNEALKQLESGISVAERDFMKYEEVQDGNQDEAIKRKLKDLLGSRARLRVIIVDPHDKMTHIATGNAEDFSEVFYARSIHPVMEAISLLHDTAVIVTADHGFCEIKELRTVRGIFIGGQPRASDTLYDPGDEDRKGHFGKRYIDLGTRQFNQSYYAPWLRLIPDPDRWGLPDSNGYLIAVGNSGFSLDAGPVRMFAHGGVSLEEMIVPVAVLATKK